MKLKKVGRKREVTSFVESILKRKKEIWPSDLFRDQVKPNEYYNQIFKVYLKNKPIAYLKKRFSNTKKQPQIMFLGAGKGNYISLFNEALKESQIKANIDVFSLTKNLDNNIKKIVQKDYSANIPFEELNRAITNKLVKTLQTELLFKCDVIVSPLGVAFHTYYPINAIFTSALMLKKGGTSYLQVNDKSTLYDLFFNKQYNINKDPVMKHEKQKMLNSLAEIGVSEEQYKRNIRHVPYYQKQIDNVEQIFQRFVNAYNKNNNTDLRYTINILETNKASSYKSEGSKILYFEIKRTN